jgi:hypothetical protein
MRAEEGPLLGWVKIVRDDMVSEPLTKCGPR